MASFRIHEDQENNSTVLRKDNADVFGAVQRRALGDLNHFGCSQNRNPKQTSMTNGLCKVQDENRTVRQIKNDKNILPPVAQFRAFSVYEDNPKTENEVKKREPTFKPFVPKEVKKDNYFLNAAENIKALCAQLEKPLDRPKEALARIPLQAKKDKDVVESPMSVVDSSMLSMSVSQYESTILEDTIHEVDEKAKIKREIDLFFHVAEYQKDIYAYMREIEVKHRPNPRYMRKQPDISQMMRSILVDWLVEVCDEYSQQSETLHLAVSYVDRFLSYMSVVRTKLQLVGTAATYIAAKYEEVFPPEVLEFVYITDDTYTKREVLRMEHLILKVLSFDLSTPTSLAFISHICIAANIPNKTKHLAAYIAELCLLEGETYLQFLPSTIASAALATALHCLTEHECPAECSAESAGESSEECAVECEQVSWSCALRRYTGYRFADLTPCLRELARTHKHALLQPYHSIIDKYKNNKFDSVSTLEPRPMFPVGRYVAPAPAPQRPQPQPNSRALS